MPLTSVELGYCFIIRFFIQLVVYLAHAIDCLRFVPAADYIPDEPVMHP